MDNSICKSQWRSRSQLVRPSRVSFRRRWKSQSDRSERLANRLKKRSVRSKTRLSLSFSERSGDFGHHECQREHRSESRSLSSIRSSNRNIFLSSTNFETNVSFAQVFINAPTQNKLLPNKSTFLYQVFPESLRFYHNFLLKACHDGHLDSVEHLVHFLQKLYPDFINMQEPTAMNTALHVACRQNHIVQLISGLRIAERNVLRSRISLGIVWTTVLMLTV